ncbi:hypothetical protein M3Y94_00905600 [Aphelenchoides besseyi]|nr:hypothetical protein M3Y94_00905600 [Aphelenchoides besseyi]
MSNYEPILSQRLSAAVGVTFCISSLLFPVILYLILRKSRQMKLYRFLFEGCSWCYIYHTCTFGARPTFLFPSFCLILDPILPLPRELLVLGVFFVVFVVINLDLSVVESLFYRYSQAFPGWLDVFFNESRWIYGIYFAVHTFIYASIFIPLTLGYVRDERETRRQFVVENPDLANSVDSTVILCFANSEISRRLVLWIAILLMSFFCLGTTLYFVLYFRMKQTRRQSTISSTYKMQLMLFRAISAQLYIGYCFLLLPAAFTCTLVYFQVPHGGIYSTIVSSLMSFHGPLDYLCMMYFITPYKRTILKWLRLDKGTSTECNYKLQCINKGIKDSQELDRDAKRQSQLWSSNADCRSQLLSHTSVEFDCIRLGIPKVRTSISISFSLLSITINVANVCTFNVLVEPKGMYEPAILSINDYTSDSGYKLEMLVTNDAVRRNDNTDKVLACEGKELDKPLSSPLLWHQTTVGAKAEGDAIFLLFLQVSLS